MASRSKSSAKHSDESCVRVAQPSAPRAGGPAAGAAAPEKPACVRDRILNTARESFYREGIRAVGVDTLIARSGVAKMSFYRSFRSKDELVRAYLESEAEDYWRWWEDVIGRYTHSPRKQLRALFVATAEHAAASEFRGCPFGNTLVEFPAESHPAHTVIAAFKTERHARLRELARAAGARDPDRLADELAIVLEGSAFCAEQTRKTARTSATVRAAEILIEAETRPA